jgi:hypothetical protein
MITDLLKESILQNIGPLKSAPKNWQKRCCFLCTSRGHGKDTRNRLGIQLNPQSIAINCFNCGFSAGYSEGKELSDSFKFFLRHLGIDEKFIKHIEFEIFRERNNLRITKDGEEDRESKLRSLFQRWEGIELPENSLSIKQWLEHGLDDPNFLKVVNYALQRKIYNLENFYWTPITDNHLNERLIIPYKYRNNIVGFTARLSYDIDQKIIPKYYQQCPTDFVYNLDNQQEWSRKYLIVTEGVLDAWVTDGVSVLGEVGQNKVDIINKLNKEIIVCPDRDKKGEDLVKVAIENDWAVSFPRWERDIKDAAKASEKYGKLLTLYSIIQSRISGKEKITVKWDIEQHERMRRIKYAK